MTAYDQFAKANQSLPYFADNSEPMLALESMIDAVGLRNVLFALKHIAEAKADHLSENWQDPVMAKSWTHDASELEKAARKITTD